MFLSFTENIFYLIQKPVFIIFQENSFEKQIWKHFFKKKFKKKTFFINFFFKKKKQI